MSRIGDKRGYEYPLLAPFVIWSATPEQFKNHVRSLLNRPPAKSIKIKAPKPQIIYKRTAKGNLSVSIKRDPKWITQAELELISRELKWPLNEVWLKVITKGGAELRRS